MKITKTEIEGVLLLEPKIFGDNRGWFFESYSKLEMQENDINIEFVQDNHSFSLFKGTLRGLHFQNYPKAQTKLIRCTKGSILDVAVDIRKDSPTYKKWISFILSSDNKKQLLIPKGFAHGFLTLEDNVEVQYKVDDYYNPNCDRSIRYDDPEINVDWNFSYFLLSKSNLILSDKDLKAPYLKDSDCNLSYLRSI